MRNIAFAVAAFATLPALAAYPEKPVTLVVPFAAGGPTDKVARDLAEVLRKGLHNQIVVIENVGGAGGTLGAAKVAKAAPDGYTLLLHHIGMSTAPALYRNLPFKVLTDFEYLGMINEVPMTLEGTDPEELLAAALVAAELWATGGQRPALMEPSPGTVSAWKLKRR